MVWRAWNFEPDAGEGLNGYIRQYGIHKDTLPADSEAFTRDTHLHNLYSPLASPPAGVFIDGDIS
jgi:hypothetical protein